MMMDGMMNPMGGMMTGMGLLGLLVIIVLLLLAAAAVKYLFFDKRKDRRPDVDRSATNVAPVGNTASHAEPKPRKGV